MSGSFAKLAPMTNRWVLGARPRTLPAALAPVVVGTACATGEGGIIWWRAVAAGVVALAIQIGTNYANDVADGVRGTDQVRVGPTRLVASGLASAREVRLAMAAAALVAAAAGLALTAVVGPELLAIGAASMLAGYFYTGGPRPYGYYGFGELFVFVFFGLVATMGSAYVQLERLTALSFFAAVPIGLLATALLVANNLRDIPTDTVSGKRTLAVRLGDAGTRQLYMALLAGAFATLVAVAAIRWPAMLGLATLPLAVAPGRAVARGANGRALIAVLGATARTQLVFALLLAVGLWLGA